MSSPKLKFWHEQTVPRPKPKIQTPRARVFTHEEPVQTIEQIVPKYSVHVVAESLGVNPFTVYHWRSEGLIDGKKYGRDVRFTAQDIRNCEIRREKLARGEVTYDQLKREKIEREKLERCGVVAHG